MKQRLAILAAVGLTVTAPVMAAETVQIGIVSATSGPLAAPGKFQLNGFKLAAEEINKGGGFQVGGKTYEVRLKIYDTRCNPTEGASAMQRLTTVDRVPVVLGELCSNVALTESVIAQDNKTPFILTVPTAEKVTEQGNQYLFRVNAHNGQLTVFLADYVSQQGWSPVSYIAWNNDTGRGGVKGMQKLLAGSIKSGYVGYFNVGEVDFSSHISNIRAEGAQAVVLFMDEEPGSLAIKQIRNAGLDINLVGTLAMGSNRFLKRLDADKLKGMVQYANFPPNADVPRIKKFSALYRAKYGEESHGFAAQSYDGLFVAVEAMKAAGSVSDGTAIRDALRRTDYDGVIGKIKFDAKGQNDPAVFVTRWCDDGTREVVAPAAARAPCGKG